MASGNFEDLILRDTLANRPAAGIPGRLFYNTTDSVLQRDNGATWDDVEGTGGGGGGGGTAFAQTLDYPTTFTGDVIDGSSTTPFVDVNAFDTKEVLNSKILHLVTSGASKNNRVRVTLGTPKAGAFDIRVCVACQGMYWSNAGGDAFFDVRLSTSGDSQLALATITPRRPQTDIYVDELSFAGASSYIGLYQPHCPVGETITLRFKRDGSDNIGFSWGWGTAPMSLQRAISSADNSDIATNVSGTLARVEFAIRTPSGPGSSAKYEYYIAYVASD